jgi:hypothetical protein
MKYWMLLKNMIVEFSLDFVSIYKIRGLDIALVTGTEFTALSAEGFILRHAVFGYFGG